MLVGSGKEIRFKTTLPFMPRYSVSYDGRVKMTKVRQAIGVVDRGCYIESLCHQLTFDQRHRLGARARIFAKAAKDR